MKIVIGIFLSILVGCSSTPSIESYKDVLSSFELGSDKKTFCDSNLKPDRLIEECMHQVVLFERTSLACNETNEIDRCMKLNRNLWERKRMGVESMLEGIAYHSGDKVSAINLHKTLLGLAEKYIPQCIKPSGEYYNCGI
jgi:hypothetical protein